MTDWNESSVLSSGRFLKLTRGRNELGNVLLRDGKKDPLAKHLAVDEYNRQQVKHIEAAEYRHFPERRVATRGRGSGCLSPSRPLAAPVK